MVSAPSSLERVGLDLVVDADAAPLLPHIDEHARASGLDAVERHVQLRAAVAAHAAEDVAREALAVDADEDRLGGVGFAKDEGDVLFFVHGGAVGHHPSFAVTGGQTGLGHAFNEPFVLQAVGDDVGHADDAQALALGQRLQAGAAAPSCHPRAGFRR